MSSEPVEPVNLEADALLEAYGVAADLAWRCRKLQDAVQSEDAWTNKDIIGMVVNTLMTEFWDHCFSQTEIRNAFLEAVADMNRYAAGEELRP